MRLSKNTKPIVKKNYDLGMIDKMCRGNQEQVRKMVKVFIVQISQSVEAIKSAFHEKDLVAVKGLIHKIKPTLGYYGTVRLEKELLSIETLIREEFPTIELDLKIMRLDYLVIQVVDRMKNDFQITKI
jgi:HPt (histidine-containing phosphotransfer) domain-containing protein